MWKIVFRNCKNCNCKAVRAIRWKMGFGSFLYMLTLFLHDPSANLSPIVGRRSAYLPYFQRYMIITKCNTPNFSFVTH